ncbi:MAG: hypothetical protein Q9228_007047 [Teloschistes exilis]
MAIHGETICTTDFDLPSSSHFVISSTASAIPLSSFSNWGILTPSLCTQEFDGIPTENIPVLSLIETRTVTAQGLQGLSPPDSAGQVPASVHASPTTSSIGICPTSTALPQPVFASTLPPLAPTLNPNPPITGESGSSNGDNNVVPQPAKPAEEPSVSDSQGGSAEVPNDQSPAGVPNNSGNDQGVPKEAPASPVATGNVAPKDTPVSSVVSPTPNAQNANVHHSTEAAAVSLTKMPPPLPLLTAGGQTLTSNAALQIASQEPNKDAITVGGLVFTHGLNSALLIGTQTITPGASAVLVSGTPVSVAAAGTALAVGSTTGSMPTPLEKDNVVLDGFTFTRDQNSNLVIGGQTITPGAPEVLLSGTPVSLAMAGTALAVGSVTSSIPIPPNSDVVAVDDFTFTRDQDSHLIIGSQTMSPGTPAVIVSGTPISLAPSGSLVVIASSTSSLIQTPPEKAATSGASVILDVGGISLIEISGSDFVIGSQTVLPGRPAITINGTEVISLPPGATGVVVDSQTAALVTSQALGDVILSAFFPQPPPAATSTNRSSPQAFTGDSRKIFKADFRLLFAEMVLLNVFLLRGLIT